MRRRKLMWFLALAFVAAGVIELWDLYHAESPAKRKPEFSVSFQNYSNSPSGEKWTVLMITNRDVCTLVFQVPARVQFLDQPDLKAWRILLNNNPLPRKAACRVAIQLPSPSGAWKFVCPVTRYARREEFGSRLPGWVDRWVPRTSGDGYAETGWINQ